MQRVNLCEVAVAVCAHIMTPPPPAPGLPCVTRLLVSLFRWIRHRERGWVTAFSSVWWLWVTWIYQSISLLKFYLYLRLVYYMTTTLYFFSPPKRSSRKKICILVIVLAVAAVIIGLIIWGSLKSWELHHLLRRPPLLHLSCLVISLDKAPPLPLLSFFLFSAPSWRERLSVFLWLFLRYFSPCWQDWRDTHSSTVKNKTITR